MSTKILSLVCQKVWTLHKSLSEWASFIHFSLHVKWRKIPEAKKSGEKNNCEYLKNNRLPLYVIPFCIITFHPIWFVGNIFYLIAWCPWFNTYDAKCSNTIKLIFKVLFKKLDLLSEARGSLITFFKTHCLSNVISQ